MESIAPAGRIAAFVTAACCVAVGLGFGVSLLDDLACARPSCQGAAAAAALMTIGALGLIALGVAISIGVRRRPVDEDGATGWFWGVGSIFLVSASVTAAWLVPSATCPEGGVPDSTLGRCLLGHDRLPMTSWVWLEWMVVAGGLVGGVILAKLRRQVWLNAAVSVAALASVTIWLLA